MVANRKFTAREKNKLRIRKKVSGTDARPRVSIFRSSKHIYAQIVSDESNKTIVSASTLEKEVRDEISKVDTAALTSQAKSTKSLAAARAVGLVLARRSKEVKVEHVVFDRNGFVYTGRIKALADGAREGGLDF